MFITRVTPANPFAEAGTLIFKIIPNRTNLEGKAIFLSSGSSGQSQR
jgi:hypothetical protein